MAPKERVSPRDRSAAGATSTSAAAPEPKTSVYVVARGRTVRAPDKNTGLMRDHGPGEEVELDRNEARSLRDSGYIVNPEAKPVRIADGRNVEVEPEAGSTQPKGGQTADEPTE